MSWGKIAKDATDVILHLLWRSFGLFLFILGGSAGVGAALTGNWVTGVVIAWGTLMIGVIGWLGYKIATTGQATKADVETGVRDAVEKAQDKQSK
jgi:hypothetical protein